ncbi:MAG: hypothetical protein HDS62_03040, partial [Bacteroidales bacterium]|nr:hypothetical protein [Bacteroidales bacterium]
DVKTLCMSIRINPWAKWKPENIGSYTPLTLEQRQKNNFGLRVGYIYNGSNIATAIKNGVFDSGWSYERVDENGWGRMTDFLSPDYTRGYDHNAQHPFPTLHEGVVVINSSATEVETVIVCMPPFMSPDAVSLNELIGPGNRRDLEYSTWYFGILMVSKTGNNILACSSDMTLANETAWQVVFGNIPHGLAGEYTAVPVLSSSPLNPNSPKVYPTMGIPVSNSIIGLGSKGVTLTLKIKGKEYEVTITCEYTNRIKYTITIVNTTTIGHTFNSPTIWVAKDDKGTGALKAATLATVTVAAGQTWTTSGTCALPTGASASTHRYAQLTFTGDQATDWTMFRETFKPAEPIPLG